MRKRLTKGQQQYLLATLLGTRVEYLLGREANVWGRTRQSLVRHGLLRFVGWSRYELTDAGRVEALRLAAKGVR